MAHWWGLTGLLAGGAGADLLHRGVARAGQAGLDLARRGGSDRVSYAGVPRNHENTAPRKQQNAAIRNARCRPWPNGPEIRFGKKPRPVRNA